MNVEHRIAETIRRLRAEGLPECMLRRIAARMRWWASLTPAEQAEHLRRNGGGFFREIL